VATQVGADATLPKPFDLDDLLTAVRGLGEESATE
jgi:DNA-binding response OmpR family regulator